MTYDQPRSPPPQGPPGGYEQNDPRYPQAGSYQSNYAAQPFPEPDRYRTHTSSTPQRPTFDADATGYIQVHQPINDAVASGINATDNTSTFSPEMISQLTSQITASVLEKLKGQNMQSTGNAQAPSVPAPIATSPTTTGSPPIDRNTIKTPPSPYRASEEAAQTPVSPAHANFSHISYPPSSPPQNRRPMSPTSQAGQADDTELPEERTARPRGPKRISTGGDATIIEKTWGALFTEDGQTTLRLGQFLRGIAVHIIEDYEPKHSLVITPPKMQRYYEETKLSTELYPWKMIFDDRTSSISRLYREFEAQHHLVQDRLDKRPGIPGLTPHGFEKWATMLLRAHPDQEFERLSKTAREMPISNPDDRKERFPKEISRRLFPRDPDHEIVAKLQNEINAHCGVIFQPRQDSMTDNEQLPPPTSHRSDDPMQPSPTKPIFASNKRQDSVLSPVTSRTSPPPNYLGIDRDHKPRSNAPSDAAISEEDDDVPTPQPIERERKPYVAQPGGGKTYEDMERSNTFDYNAPPPELKPARTMSMNHGQMSEGPKSRVAPIAIHQRPPPPPMDSGEVRHARSNSFYTRDAQGRVLRQRSPSLSANGKDYGHRSEGDVAYGSSYTSTTSNDVAEEARKYREYELQRERNANDRYDAARMAAYDPRDRERDSRARMQSNVGVDGRPQYATDDEYYRSTAPSYPTPRDPYQQYPPSSYSGR